MTMLNSMGDSTPPCGTPVSCGNGGCCITPPTQRVMRDCAVRVFSKSVKSSGTPMRSRISQMMSCDTESYAFLKSINTRTVSRPCRTRWRRASRSVRIWNSHPCRTTKPVCAGEMTPLTTAQWLSLVPSTRPNSLARTLGTQMPR